MCGIAGVLGSFPATRASAMVGTMLEAQIHRGPDDVGAECWEPWPGTALALGNRRLAIQDLSPLGHQPMRNPSTGDVVVYNGEIYNAPGLRSALESSGHQFRGRSDTEVLLKAYEAWGKDALQRLRGMFAFALWDERRRTLFLARDPLGIKPLYYMDRLSGGLAFSSEIRALTFAGVSDGRIERRALAGYLAYGGVQEPLTIFDGVLALPPGSFMEVSRTGPGSPQRYWLPPVPEPQRRGLSTKDLGEEARSLLQQSVSRHLLSDVPVGVFLSSGLDSTAVTGLARLAKTGDVHTFTVSFPDQPDLDEAPLARETARRLGTVHHEISITSSTALAWAVDGLRAMDQPAMDGLNAYIVSRAVREQGIAVALSGQGGDEVFGGYDSFWRVRRWRAGLRWLAPLPANWRAGLAGTGAALFGLGHAAKGKAVDLARTGPDLPGLCFQYRRLMSDQDLAHLGLSADDVGLSGAYQSDPPSALPSDDPTSTVQRMEQSYYLRNILLRDGDVFGMANSLEIRVPMLDLDLVEWALRLPGDTLRPPGGPSKPLLRLACQDLFTPELEKQRKRGFVIPYADWLQGTLRGVMEDALIAVQDSGLMEARGITEVKGAFLSEPHTPAWSRAWALVALGSWLQRQRTATVPVAV